LYPEGIHIEGNNGRFLRNTFFSAPPRQEIIHGNDHAEQPERCDKFAKELCAAGAGVLRELYDGFAKHQMCSAHADNCTEYLGADICWDIPTANAALGSIR
jgi:dienelactone hydrolase